MELRSIRVFVMTAKYRNFSKVAEILFLSQSSVSKYISTLESELGQQLLIRDTKSMHLTKFGEEFIVYATRLLDQEDAIHHFISNYNENKSYKSITLGVDDSLLSAPPGHFLIQLVKCMSVLRIEYPEYHISVSFNSEFELKQKVKHKQIDFAILTLGYTLNKDSLPPHVILRSLTSAENYLYYSPLLPRSDDVVEIANAIDSISYADDPVPRQVTMEFLNKLGIAPKLVPTKNWSEIFIRMQYEKCAALSPHTLLSIAEECGIPYIPLEQYGIHSENYAIYHDSLQSDIADRLCEALKQCFSPY